MPQKVQEKKKSMNLQIAISTAILSLIPVIILVFTGFSSFQTPYGIYSLVALGIGVYFSCIFGMFAWKNKILYIVLDIMNIILMLFLVIYGYINSSYQNGLLLHIGAAFLFAFGIYQSGDSDQDGGYYLRHFIAPALDIAGLIFVLWFIGVKMNVTVHIVIVSILNVFNLIIFLIPSLCKSLSNLDDFFDGMENEEIEYDEETEEEKAARREEKAARREEKMAKRTSKTVVRNPDGTIDTSRWKAYHTNIDMISKSLTKQYNSIIDHINDSIRDNNREIDNPYFERHLKNAVASNKDVKKCVRYFKRKLKIVRKNLEKISKTEFTANDKYKSFSFYLLKGKLKSRPSENEEPELRIMRCHIWYEHPTMYGNYKEEILIEAQDIYLSPVK